MIRFSVRFNNDMPATRYAALAQAAEQAGFDQFWVSDDLFLRGVWPILSACAVATRRIELGSCIVNPYTTHPAEIAMQAAALDELSGGRFNLGIAAGAGEFMRWIGLPYTRPLATTAATLRALRALFAGELPAHTPGAPPGWNDDAYMRFGTRRIPLYLGATSPKMTHMIGELADGGLPLLFPPEHYTAVAALVAAGAASTGRDATAIDLAACIWVSVDADHTAAEAALREKIAYYGSAMSDDILARLGVARDEMLAIDRMVHEARAMARAMAMVTPAMLQIGIVGTTADLIPRLEALVAAGARHLSFGPPLGPDPLAALQLIGRDIIPYFRS